MRTQLSRSRIALALVAAACFAAKCAQPFDASAVASTHTPRLGPAGNAFYTPPRDLPKRAGDVIWYRPSALYVAPAVKAAARVWTMLYRSTSATGQPVAVSGAVIEPSTPWRGPGPRPIVAYSPGTTGMADSCANTRQFTTPTSDSYEGPFITMALNKGWAVAFTDYQGLGTPGQHTYVVGQALGRDSLDAVRAAQRLPAAGLSQRAPVLIWGYSEGGDGAGWAAALARTYAPELHVLGAAFGGTPSDLLAIFKARDGGPFAVLVAMGAIGLNTAYPSLHLERYLTAQGKKDIALVEDTCLYEGIPLGAFERSANFTTTDITTLPAWRRRLRENTLADVAPPSIPIYLYHATQDEAVPYPQALALREKWCAEGADISWHALPGEHLAGAAEGAPGAIQFLAARLAGEAPTPNCGP